MYRVQTWPCVASAALLVQRVQMEAHWPLPIELPSVPKDLPREISDIASCNGFYANTTLVVYTASVTQQATNGDLSVAGSNNMPDSAELGNVSKSYRSSLVQCHSSAFCKMQNC